jgi:chemosensory pili system protein ChpA (sensor histidine kinase/response regulator)
MLESLDPSILLGFIEEAQSYMPTIRAGIVAFQNDDSRREEIQLSYRQIHTVKGAALMIGLYDLAELAGEIENVLEPLSDDDGTLEKQTSLLLLTRLEQIADTLGIKALELRALISSRGEETENLDGSGENFSPGDYSQFDRENFENQSASNGSQSFNAFSASVVEDETEEEIDPEMLEVFTLEAEEHLQNISTNLQLIEQNPNHAEALQSIRRSAHTLKGAAGVVGFKTTARLAHRMEDLLDRLAEHPLDSTPQTTAVLLSATDLLEALARGASKRSLRNELNSLYARFDGLLPSGSSVKVLNDSSTDSLSEFADPQAAAYEETLLVENNVSAIWDGPVEEIESNAQAAAAAPRTIVRVGLDRLDEMVNLMGEMVINRTTLEQRLKDLELQLGEMRLTTNRLRHIAGKLELDYEASALSGGGNVSSGVLRALSSNQISNVNSFALSSDQTTASLENKYGFDDLEFDRYTEFHELTRQLAETSSDTSAINGDLDDALSDLDGLLTRQRRLSDELQEKLMRLRMVPLGTLSARLHRTVRVTAEAENKMVDLIIEGEEIEIDTQVLNSLTEPLLHLLRNSVVHGIEPSDVRLALEKPARGTIKLRGFYEGTHIILSIIDDGQGMNPHLLREKAVEENFLTAEAAEAMNDEQALSLIFLPGFSTAKKLTESAGRGVGMDIVRASVTRQQGTISTKSKTQSGTTISIRLPMSMAVTRSLIVRALGRRYAIPLNTVLQLSQVSSRDFDQLTEEKIIWVGGKFYPVFSLNDLLGLPELADRDNERIPALLIQLGEATIALTFDEVVEAREIVIKPFVNTLFKLHGLLGATILGDGSVVPILDLLPLLQPKEQNVARYKWEDLSQDEIPPLVSSPAKTVLTVMVVDDSPSVRRVMSNFITKSGLTVVIAKDGLDAVEILQQSRELPDVILSDVEMPRMDGYELLATLKRQEAYRNIPIVMITSRAGEKHRLRALELGASDYVTKPYQDSVLLETIKQLAQ